nr:hypothetical protein HUO10_000855 [Paraburkholderia busanensis]
MLKRSRPGSNVSTTQQNHLATQKSRTESLRQEEADRAQKRLDGDALIDVNAAKWRYVSTRD